MSELSGCPFCGADESQCLVDEVSPGEHAVCCEQCGCIGPTASTGEQASRTWEVGAHWKKRALDAEARCRSQADEIRVMRNGSKT